MKLAVFATVLVLALVAFGATQSTAPQSVPAKVSAKDAAPFLGAWDIPIPQGEGRPNRNCWLEVKLDGEVLAGRFLGGGGSPGTLRDITVQNGELRFAQGGGGGFRAPAPAAGQASTPVTGQTPPDRQAGTPVPQGAPGAPARAPRVPTVYTAVVKDGKLVGKVTQGERVTEWVGVRPPKWPDTPPTRKPGKPVALFNGKDLTGWHAQNPNPNRPYDPAPLGWEVLEGALHNPKPPAANIVSDQKFMDYKLEVEFKVEDHTNSGVYIRGRHEIQIENDYGKQPTVLTSGAIYGFIPPSVEPSLPVGEWQKLEATVIGNRVTIIMNGKKVHDNVVIPAITGGALDTNEGEPGPVMLQGDHSVVFYRKVVVTPLI